MKSILKITLVALTVAALAVSCKTSEKNYRQAYEVAKTSRLTEDSTMLSLVEKERAPISMAVGEDTIKYRKEFVTITKDAGGTSDMLKRYNIVVGRFRQVFNAKSMQSRMAGLGYTAYVIETREPAYFVVVYSTDLKEEVAKKFQEVVADKRVVFKTPFPWVLEPARYVQRKK